MKSYKSLLLIALFIGTFLPVFVTPVRASTGPAHLGYVNNSPPLTTSTFSGATSTDAVRAGSSDVYKQDGTPPVGTAMFTIDLTSVTFSGAQFALYLSRDGLSQVSPGDILYTGYFSVATLQTTAISSITFSSSIWQGGSATFYYGTLTAGNPIVSGPVPFYVPGGNYYIKIYDGSSTFLAVSLQQVIILPDIYVSPAGPNPAGTPVTVQGVAWPSPAGLVNLTVWDPAGTTIRYSWLITPASDGSFTQVFAMPDEGKFAGIIAPAFTPAAQNVEAFNTTDNLTPSDPDLDVTKTVSYIGRQFDAFLSYSASGTSIDQKALGAYGSTGDLTAVTLDAKVLGLVDVNGSNFNPSGALTAYLDWGTGSQQTLSYVNWYALDSAGTFAINITIPATTKGTHLVSIVDASWSWNFTLNVLTTLTLTPNHGPVSTVVTATGYGFDGNEPVTIFFLGTDLSLLPNPDDDYVLVASGFNSSASGYFTTTFTVPAHAFGGAHIVYGNTSTTTVDIPVFTVEASFWSPDSSTQALGNKFRVLGEGIVSGSGTYLGSSMFAAANGEAYGATPNQFYAAAYDNAITFNGGIFGTGGDSLGQLEFDFIAAGVPMTHIIQVFDATSAPAYTQVATFNLAVTGSTLEGTQILSQLSSLATSTAAIQSALSALSTSVGSLQTSVNNLASADAAGFAQLNTKADNLATAVTGVNTAISNLQTHIDGQFTGVNSAIGALQSHVDGQFSSLNTAITGAQSALTTQIGTVNTAVSGLQNSVNSLSGSVATLSGTVNDIKSTVGTVSTATSALSTISTVLYIAVILVAIAVVLEIVVLVRKK